MFKFSSTSIFSALANNYKIFIISKPYEIISLFIFYSLANIGILLLYDAKFWDDWTLWNTDTEVIRSQFKQNGLYLFGEIHVFLKPFSPWIYKLLTFILWFFCGFLILKILRKSTLLNPDHAYNITLLFLITPYFSARVAMIDFPYLVCLTLFLFAWYISNYSKVVSFILFFVSFSTQSLLMFYAIPVFDSLYNSTKLNNLKLIMHWGVKNSVFLILPFVFFGVKNHFFPPSGFYANYNQTFSIKTLFNNIPIIIKEYFVLEVNIMLFVILCLITCFILFKKDLFLNAIKKYILVGLVVIFFGAFPYMIVGHLPMFDDWNSRHQLLLPLGASIFIIGLSSWFFKRIKINLLLIVIPLFITLNIQSYYSYFNDWQKQKRIMEKLKYEHPEISDIDLLLIVDKTPNAKNRYIRFYEWNGMLKYINGHSKVFAIDSEDYQSFENGYFDNYINNKDYNSFGFTSSKAKKIKILEIEKVGKFYNTNIIDFTNDTIQ